MIETELLLFIGLAFTTIFYLYFKTSGKNLNLNLPPGPTPLPILGNVFAMRKKFHLQLVEYTKTYGNILTFWLGSNRTIILSDAKLIREAFNDPNFTGRPDIESVNIFSGGPRGVLNSTGKEWAEQRRWTVRHLRDFGFGKTSMESMIMEEVNELLESFENLKGQPVDVSRKFSLAVLNSLWQILTSKRYRHDDPELNHILQNNTTLLVKLTTNPLLILPSLAKKIPNMSGWNSMVELVGDIRKFIQDNANEHMATFTENGAHRDFVDAYIQQIKQTTDPTSSFYKELGEINLHTVLHDLFAAGSENISATLIYTILILSKFQNIQKKVQQELDRVIGRNRQPTLGDRIILPYCTAVLEEVLRFNSLVPLGAFHVAQQDTKFHGYDIQKGTWVVANLYWINYNPENFPNPMEFNPERFLSDDGKLFKKNENMIIFSVGKRACPGENLARDESFLFFTSIFQKFQIRLTEEFENVNIVPTPASVLKPPEFKVIMLDRF